MRYIFAATLLTFLFSVDVKSSSTDHSKGLDQLSFLQGGWKVTYFSPGEDGSMIDLGSNKASYKSTLQGRLIEGNISIITQSGLYPIRNFYSYDNQDKIYRFNSIDAVTGVMDTYEGQWTENKLVITNLKHQNFKTADGRRMAYRITLEKLSDTSYERRIEYSDDDGQNWHFISLSKAHKNKP